MATRFLRGPLATIATLLLVAAAVAILVWSQENGDVARQKQLELVHIELEAAELVTLTHEAALGEEVRREVDEVQAHLTRDVREFGGSERRIAATFERLSRAADRSVTLAEAGQLDQSFEVIEAQLDPSHEDFKQAMDRKSADYAAVAVRAKRNALIGGIVALLFAVGAVRFLFWRVSQARERHVLAAAREAALAEQNKELLAVDRMKDEFVASVSHELRTPLTSIRGYLELVLDGEAGELTPNQVQFLGVVDRNAERLLRVVSDLLFVAQVDAGKLALERADVDVEEIVRHAVDAARPAAAAKEIDLSLDLQPLPAMRADGARLGQLLDNLVSNAIKFTPAGGSVVVRGLWRDDKVVVEVSDTGAGIAAADQAQLFDRFFRTSDATNRAVQGTGLGLAIAKAIAEAHGGTIAVESEEGRGTTFRVTLPCDDPSTRAPAPALAEA